jgi:hypothetical protein
VTERGIAGARGESLSIIRCTISRIFTYNFHNVVYLMDVVYNSYSQVVKPKNVQDRHKPVKNGNYITFSK